MISLLTIILCWAVANSQKTIYVGVSTMEGTVDPTKLQYAKAANYSLNMFETMFAKVYNSTVMVNQEPYKLAIKKIEDGGNRTRMIENYNSLCNDTDVFAFMTPNYSEFGYEANEIGERCQKLNLGSASYLPSYFFNENSHKQTFQVCTAVDRTFETVLPSFRYLNSTKVSLLYGTNHFLESTCNITDKTAKLYGLEIVSRVQVTSAIDLTANETELNLALKKTFDAKAEILIMCVYFPVVDATVRRIKAEKINYKGIIAYPKRAEYDTMPTELNDYLFTMQDNHPDIHYSQDEYFANFTEFINNYTQLYNTPLFSTSACTFYSMATLVKALQEADSINLTHVIDSLSRVSYSSILGEIEFDGRHVPKVTLALIQYFNGTSYVVWPPLTSTKQMVLPIPTWAERKYESTHTKSEIGFITLSGVFGLVSLIFMILVIYWRNHTIIRVSMPLFLILILAGSMLMYSSVYFWIDRRLTTSKCLARIWILDIGFTILFGSLFAKSFGIWRMWRASINSNVKITQNLLLIIVITMTSVQTVLLILLSILGDVKPSVKILDPLRPLLNEEFCYYNKAGTILMGLMVGFTCVVVALSLVIGWGLRKIAFLAFNETKIIAFATYNVTFFFFIAIVVVVSSGRIFYQTSFVLKTTCILFSAFFIVFVLFVNKFWLIYHNKDAKSKRKSKNTTSMFNRKPNELEKQSSKDGTTQDTVTTTNDEDEAKGSPTQGDEMILISKIEYKKLKKSEKRYKQNKVKLQQLKQIKQNIEE